MWPIFFSLPLFIFRQNPFTIYSQPNYERMEKTEYCALVVCWLSMCFLYGIHTDTLASTMIRKLRNRMNNCYIVNLHLIFFGNSVALYCRYLHCLLVITLFSLLYYPNSCCCCYCTCKRIESVSFTCGIFF